MNGEAGKAMAKPISNEILERLKVLAEKAAAVNDRTQGKLTPVMISPRPVGTPEGMKEPREYPPLFAEIRERLNIIDAALDGISEALSRTEL